MFLKRILFQVVWAAVMISLPGLAGCTGRSGVTSDANKSARVLTTSTYLADIAQNIAGDRIKVEALIPAGSDPHTFSPTPRDIARIAQAQLVIINGGGLDYWIEEALANAGGSALVVEASQGLVARTPVSSEPSTSEHDQEVDDHPQEGDPHFWLDPNLVVQYVENIREGFVSIDPEGSDIYASNARAYTEQLVELDAWIQEQVAQIPPGRRLLVTNHESFGYYADRYGFQIIGAIIPSISSGSSPTAQQLSALVEQIRSSSTPAIFLEVGSNPELAEQIAAETGVKIVTGLHTHSLSESTGPASGYIAMIRYDTGLIVEALR